MRGEVATALVHRPRLLVLDEPTIGLDVLSKERLRQFLIAERARENMTLLLTENWSRTTSTRRWNLLYVTTFRGLALRSRGQDGLGAGRVSVGQMVRSLGMRIQPMK
jgi:predicted ABC-type transport system involved in lysophospholipase L1 biosynthesis ATPase subunit